MIQYNAGRAGRGRTRKTQSTNRSCHEQAEKMQGQTSGPFSSSTSTSYQLATLKRLHRTPCIWKNAQTSAWNHIPILLACGTVLSALDLWGKGWRGQGRSTGHAEHTQEIMKTMCAYGNYETQPNTASGRQRKLSNATGNPWFVSNLSRIRVLLTFKPSIEA